MPVADTPAPLSPQEDARIRNLLPHPLRLRQKRLPRHHRRRHNPVLRRNLVLHRLSRRRKINRRNPNPKFRCSNPLAKIGVYRRARHLWSSGAKLPLLRIQPRKTFACSPARKICCLERNR